ncbi:putative multiple-sugar transport system permease YteP [compost metagenome]
MTIVIQKQRKAKKRERETLGRHVRKEWALYSFLLIPVIYFIIFKYAPMLGNIIAFRKYRGGPNFFGTEWVGFKYFEMFLKDKIFWRAFQNNLTLSVSYLLIRFPMTLIFALLLNEIRNMSAKKFVQTVSYLPHFISTVIVAGMVKEMLSMNGPINELLGKLGFAKLTFISLPEWFPTIYITSGIWQSLGWGTILYLAAMTGINTELYEAARIDGASRFRLAWHVTIPGILPTIMTLLILDIGGILGSNFEKILLLYNPLTYKTADVISTYVYRMGISGGSFSYATAVGLFEGIIGLILVTAANYISRKTTKSSLW